MSIEAVKAEREVGFVNCACPIEDLWNTHRRGILKNMVKHYIRSKLLIVDELGYLDIEEGGGVWRRGLGDLVFVVDFGR